MMIEARLVDQRRDTNVGHVDKIIRKKKFHRRTKRPTGLQRLFVSCKEVFRGHGIVPSPSDVQKLCHILDGMIPEDVGLSRDLQFFKPKNPVKGTPRITCTTIYQCVNFSLCMFFLPATAVIPLHNHPGMTVFSKLLRGTMHIKAHDWVDPVNSDDSVQPSQHGEKNTVAKEGGGDSYGWLEEIEMPEDSQMDGIEYLGPPISEFIS